MPVIPETLYRHIEKRLKDRYTAIARAEQRLFDAQLKAYAVSAPAPDKTGGGRGSAQGSRVERAAQGILLAEEELETARKWEDVFVMADRSFPPGTPEEKAVKLVYKTGHTKKSAAQILRVRRELLDKQLTAYVCHCAVYAAAAGLIRMEGAEK